MEVSEILQKFDKATIYTYSGSEVDVTGIVNYLKWKFPNVNIIKDNEDITSKKIDFILYIDIKNYFESKTGRMYIIKLFDTVTKKHYKQDFEFIHQDVYNKALDYISHNLDFSLIINDTIKITYPYKGENCNIGLLQNANIPSIKLHYENDINLHGLSVSKDKKVYEHRISIASTLKFYVFDLKISYNKE